MNEKTAKLLAFFALEMAILALFVALFAGCVNRPPPQAKDSHGKALAQADGHTYPSVYKFYEDLWSKAARKCAPVGVDGNTILFNLVRASAQSLHASQLHLQNPHEFVLRTIAYTDFGMFTSCRKFLENSITKIYLNANNLPKEE